MMASQAHGEAPTKRYLATSDDELLDVEAHLWRKVRRTLVDVAELLGAQQSVHPQPLRDLVVHIALAVGAGAPGLRMSLARMHEAIDFAYGERFPASDPALSADLANLAAAAGLPLGTGDDGGFFQLDDEELQEQLAYTLEKLVDRLADALVYSLVVAAVTWPQIAATVNDLTPEPITPPATYSQPLAPPRLLHVQSVLAAPRPGPAAGVASAAA